MTQMMFMKARVFASMMLLFRVIGLKLAGEPQGVFDLSSFSLLPFILPPYQKGEEELEKDTTQRVQEEKRVCSQCKKEFERQSFMVEHMKKYHPVYVETVIRLQQGKLNREKAADI